jgi:hypothetical protein
MGGDVYGGATIYKIGAAPHPEITPLTNVKAQ